MGEAQKSKKNRGENRKAAQERMNCIRCGDELKPGEDLLCKNCNLYL